MGCRFAQPLSRDYGLGREDVFETRDVRKENKIGRKIERLANESSETSQKLEQLLWQRDQMTPRHFKDTLEQLSLRKNEQLQKMQQLIGEEQRIWQQGERSSLWNEHQRGETIQREMEGLKRDDIFHEQKNHELIRQQLEDIINRLAPKATRTLPENRFGFRGVGRF